MFKKHLTGLAMSLLLFAACSEDPLDPQVAAEVTVEEMNFAVVAAQEAELEAAASETNAGRWHRRVLEALRNSDDPEVRALLEEMRELRQQAREAHEAGNEEEARELRQAAIERLLCAILEVYPEAAEATGAAVDRVLARIDERIGDRDVPPRLARVLNHVRELRDQADAALREGDNKAALAYNLRAIHILRRLVHHIRNHDHGDDDVDAERDIDEEVGAEEQ